MSRTIKQAAALWTLALLLLVPACEDECTDPFGSNDDPNGEEPVVTAACIGCHTDEERLEATAEPDTTHGEEPEGEG
jgi:hypothetical protein